MAEEKLTDKEVVASVTIESKFIKARLKKIKKHVCIVREEIDSLLEAVEEIISE